MHSQVDLALHFMLCRTWTYSSMLPPNSFGRDSRVDFPSGRFRLVITDAGL